MDSDDEKLMKKLKKDIPNLKAVISYADPRYNHKGKIYQAMNWLYLGETIGATHFMKDGRFYHSRTINEKNRENTSIDRSKYQKIKSKNYKYIDLFDTKNYIIDETYRHYCHEDIITPPKYSIKEGHIGPEGQKSWADYLYQQLIDREIYNV